jgi:hypothetical protein
MSTVEFKLGNEDQKTHGGPEWVPLDLAGLDEIPFETLDPLEREMWDLWKMTLNSMQVELFRGTMRGARAAVWLARKLADVKTVPLAEFRISVRGGNAVRYRVVKPEGDQIPPGSSSSTSSSEEKQSATDSKGSSRGSGKTPDTNSRRAKSGS